MKKHFYSHITDTQSLKTALEELGLPAHEIDHLVELADDNLHHTVLDAILSELSEEDKKLFLGHLAESKHDKVWEILHSKVENIEEKIQKAADAIKEELHKDIHDAKSQKKK
jgi:hypothetical protein